MIKCPKCGNEVDSDDEYCKHCSYKLKKKPITDKKNIIIIVLIIIIIAIIGVICYSMFTTEPVKVVDVGVGTFNCSNELNFTLNKTDGPFKEYIADNGRYTVKVFNLSQGSYYYNYGLSLANNEIKTYPSSVIDNVLIYNSTANVGEYVGEPRFIAIIDNNDKNLQIQIVTPEVKDTVQIANSFQFKN